MYSLDWIGEGRKNGRRQRKNVLGKLGKEKEYPEMWRAKKAQEWNDKNMLLFKCKFTVMLIELQKAKL